MNFKEIFRVMNELAEEGNEFFQNAVVEYNEASEENFKLLDNSKVNLADVQNLLKQALGIIPSDKTVTLADTQAALKKALGIETGAPYENKEEIASVNKSLDIYPSSLALFIPNPTPIPALLFNP